MRTNDDRESFSHPDVQLGEMTEPPPLASSAPPQGPQPSPPPTPTPGPGGPNPPTPPTGPQVPEGRRRVG